ncbi:MAG TPA: hypothetical protein VK809_00435 [Bacteroidia bacterium]|nr:hypothetical protein [Bacteroidia bacterium]
MITKRITCILFFTFYFSLFTFSQNIPNGGFEDWWVYPNTIHEAPKGWTDNDLLFQHFDPGYNGLTVIRTTRSHSGKYALQLGIAVDHGDTVNGGIYSTGTVDSLMQVIIHTKASGFKCSQRYGTFTGFYVFEHTPGDTAVFGAVLTRWNWATKKRDTIVNSILRIGDLHTDYVPFVVPLKYRRQNEVPDTAFISIGIQVESKNVAKIGTTLILDDLKFSGKKDDDKKK